MLGTSARLLELLVLLQQRRDWTSGALAERLGVSTRTVRADIGKLRSLGYPVDARPGVAGGYRLSAGATMPPLLLNDDEAVAVAVGLSAAAGGRLGVEETSIAVLAKLEEVMPSRLRHRVEAVRRAAAVVPGAGPALDLTVVSGIAAAIHGHERLRFGYVKPKGAEESRHVEPQRLVGWGSLWYLLAWDLDRDDWRVFRVDRMRPRTPTGKRFRPRAIPERDEVDFVVDRVLHTGWAHRARILVHAPADVVAAKIVVPVRIEAVDATSCRVELGSGDPDHLALWVTQIGVDFEVIEGDGLIAALDRLAARLQRAVGPDRSAGRTARE
ncbi:MULTISPECIES: helix-turn-helix transcriptional regulator [unclassified Leucobacter]|uniref:helix-turn-helix transcriptional regulator n=1 Tax=unclassified Leucobacter TaxID=2621730 RepID=UPI000620E5F4|nr:YafY family protein [Leucobacter sp. Ag1]KKI16580.1 DeoR faimly transcriptional regulator [Leucobacter sp. Ag1]